MFAGLIEQGKVVQLNERKLISDFLSLDRVWASEALLSMDDGFWSLASWYGYYDGSNLGLALIFPKITPAPVFLVGEPNCLANIIRREIKHEKIFVESSLSCLGILKERYNFNPALIMNKMQLQHFRPNSFSVHQSIERLKPEDFSKARELYFRTNEGTSFDPDQFQNGIYYGFKDKDKIVSMAGTTVICTDYRTATIGNVITDTEYAHKGYATSALIHLCTELIEQGYDCICIKVNRGNAQAISIYRRIGFIKKLEYFEGLGIMKQETKYG